MNYGKNPVGLGNKYYLIQNMQFDEAEKFITEFLRTGLSPLICYHDYKHTLDVVAAAEQLAADENITDRDELIILKTAALFHDCGFVSVYLHHEEEGCKIARKQLPAFDYSADEIEKICNLIMATKMPQNPASQLQQILCDADLDYLGRDDYEKTAQKLFNEWHDRGKVHSEAEWTRLQIDFLQTHHYWTKSATDKRSAKKAENLKRLKEKTME